jgi:hypothetical protein
MFAEPEEISDVPVRGQGSTVGGPQKRKSTGKDRSKTPGHKKPKPTKPKGKPTTSSARTIVGGQKRLDELSSLNAEMKLAAVAGQEALVERSQELLSLQAEMKLADDLASHRNGKHIKVRLITCGRRSTPLR